MIDFTRKACIYFLSGLMGGLPLLAVAQSTTITFRIEKRYINIPVENKASRQRVVFDVDGIDSTASVIRVATAKPDYWVYRDVSALKGRQITLRFADRVEGISRIYQDDKFPGHALQPADVVSAGAQPEDDFRRRSTFL